MATVSDLEPGNKVTLSGGEVSGTFIARQEHPYYPGLMLVIWYLSDGTWSFDALSHNQEVGEPEPSTGRERGSLLLAAMKKKSW